MYGNLCRVQGLLLAFLLIGSLAACAGLGSQQEIPLTPVPITDIKDVAGSWEGLVMNVRKGQDAGRIVVVLSALDTQGSYSFGAQTETGPLVGAGTVTLQKGRLLSETGQRTVTLTLCLRGNQKVLVVNSFGKDGNPYYVELILAQ
jgi:hypothetical protein